MHISALLLSVSLASAQYAHHQFGPGPAELEYLKNINQGPNNNQNQNQGQGHNGNGNYGNYEVGYDYQNTHIHSATFSRTRCSIPCQGTGPWVCVQSPKPFTESRSQSFGPDDYDIPVGASGGVAPINPMRPGSQVAPPPLFPDQNHGKDEGNSFCMGKCFANESDAKCAKPYSMALYKPKKGCYMCCVTSDF
ncbi:unnamed protein product [Penicillium nalgiovense]|nr:unnamed protein product [Penicillium nalgiovense]